MSDQLDNVVIDEVVEVKDTTKQPSEVTIPEEKIKEIQKKAYGYAFSQVDERLAELGHKKPDGVKTTDYLVELLTKKDNVTGTKEVNKPVEDTDAVARIKALQDALKAKESELESVKTSISTQKRDLFIDSIVNNTEIATPEHLSDQEKLRWNNRQRSLIKQELLTNYSLKEVEGSYRFYDKGGEPILDGTIEMNPISPKALIEREFSELLKTPTKQAQIKGTGTAESVNSQVAPTEKVIPSKIKTASEFYTYLREELKLVMGSEQFKEKLSKARAERPAMFN